MISITKTGASVLIWLLVAIPPIWAQERACTFESVEHGEMSGKEYYASPQGGGNCLRDKPCTLSQALDKAKSGDHVVLKDGSYLGKYQTRRDGVTIRAENKHQAVLDGGQNAEPTLIIKHSDITVRGLKIDGRKKGRLLFVAPPRSPAISNLVIEHNLLVRSSASGLQVANWGKTKPVSNMLIRHNIIRDLGTFENPGEGIYLGSSPEKEGRQVVRNVEIYGNIIEDFAHNGIDLKPNTENVSVHHNIFRKQVYKPHHKKPGNEGTFAIGGSGSKMYDNLLLSNDAGNMGAFFITPVEDHQVFGNLVKDMKSPVAFKTRTGENLLPSEVRNNVFCNIQSSKIDKGRTVNPDMLLISGNAGLGEGVAAGVCESMHQSLMAEIEKLPSGPGKWHCDCETMPLDEANAMPERGENVVVQLSPNGMHDWQIGAASTAEKDMELVPSDNGYLFRVRGERAARTYRLPLKQQDNPAIKIRFQRNVGNAGYAEVRVNEVRRIHYRGPTAQNTDTAVMSTSDADARIMMGPGCK